MIFVILCLQNNKFYGIIIRRVKNIAKDDHSSKNSTGMKVSLPFTIKD